MTSRFASIPDNRTTAISAPDAALTLARDILPAWVSRALGRPLSRLSRLGHRAAFIPPAPPAVSAEAPRAPIAPSVCVRSRTHAALLPPPSLIIRKGLKMNDKQRTHYFERDAAGSMAMTLAAGKTGYIGFLIVAREIIEQLTETAHEFGEAITIDDTASILDELILAAQVAGFDFGHGVVLPNPWLNFDKQGEKYLTDATLLNMCRSGEFIYPDMVRFHPVIGVHNSLDFCKLPSISIAAFDRRKARAEALIRNHPEVRGWPEAKIRKLVERATVLWLKPDDPRVNRDWGYPGWAAFPPRQMRLRQFPTRRPRR